MTSLPKGDDVSSNAVPLGFTLNFLGPNNSTVYVNTNGNLTFSAPFVGYPGMPADNEAGGVVPPISSSTIQIISAFLADIDTSAPAVGAVTYGTTTVNGRVAFVATFSDVTQFSWSSADFDTRRNSFQIILIDRSDTGAGNFDIEFNYDKVQWETADSNGGVNGFGGYSAQAGYANGTGLSGTFFELPGSGVPGSFASGPLSLIAGSLNSGGVAGRYVFAIRNGVSATPSLTRLSPSTAQAGGQGFTLTVNGSAFAANSTVLWNGAALATTFNSANQLTATVAASRIAAQGSFPVTVNTGGLVSNSIVFTVNPAAASTISTTSPSTAQAGGSAFALIVIGSGFASNSTILWNGAALPTIFASTNQLTGAVAASLIATAGSATITVTTNGAVSNGATFPITSAAVTAAPTISSLNPSIAQAGGPAFTLTVNGSGFASNSTIFWNGTPLSTTFGSANQLSGSISTSLIAAQGSATVTVSTNGAISNGSTFTIAPATPTISSLSPATAQAGGPAFTLTVNGSGFASNSTVLWNGGTLATTFGNASQLTASVGANLIAAQGFATVTVSTGGTVSNGLTFTIGSATPVISSLSPSIAQAGGAAFSLTVNGSGFAPNSTILWNGASLPTTFGSANQLSGAVAAGFIATQGSATVTVSTNGTISNSSTFTIAPTSPTLSNISPSTAQAGGSAFTLTVNGSGFASNSTILWNGGALATTFGNANQLTGSVGANLILAQATVTVSVNTNGLLSNSSIFTITPATANPTISNLSPASAQTGGAGFTLTVNGSGFVANSTIFWNGTPLSTIFGGANQLTGTVAASLIATPGTVTITVSANGLVSNGSTFTIGPATPTLSSLNPASVQAGGAAFTLTVNGSGFAANSSILWNGGTLGTTFGSPTQLIGSVGANLITTAGSVTVAVSTNGLVSNSSTFTITAASANPVLSSISPSSTQAGGPALTLTVNGSGFTASSAILWNGGILGTTFGSPTQLIGAVGANLIAAPGTVTIAVSTNGTVSNSTTFTIAPTAPTISSLNPSSAQAGGPAFALTVNGSGFTASSSILWNGGTLGTTFLNAGQLSGAVGANLIATPGSVSVTVTTNGLVSSSATFTIAPATSNPTISSLSPSTAQAGGAAFTLAVNGSGFAANSTIFWNGTPLSTTFGNASQLTGTVAASLLSAPASVTVTVSANGAMSNGSTFTIAPATANPTISSLSPSTAQAGGPVLTLTVNGSGFAANSTISWDGTPLPTTFVNAGQLTGIVSAGLIAIQGSAAVTVSTNGTVSNSSTFTIAPAKPAVTSLSPSSAQTGGAAFTLTVNGSGFTANSTILWNGGTLGTTFGSPTELTGAVGANLLAAPGPVTVAVSTNGLVSNSLPFTIAAPVPTITSLSPPNAPSGGAAFTLTVNGSGFGANSTIFWSGTPLSTSFGSANQLTGTVSASLIAAPGTINITVSTNGLVSSSSPFTVSATGTPTIITLSPATAQAGGAAFTLTVNGSGFSANSTISWNGASLSTTFGSANQLTAEVAAGLIATPGIATVTVSTSGTVSNGSPFTIAAATISSLSPSSAQAGGAAFTLTVSGTGFSANSTISWNGESLPTTFGSPTQLTGAVAASLIAAQGTAAITVTTNGTASNTSPFAILPATLVPTISSLIPSSTQAGGAAFTLTVSGSGFAANSRISWNGNSLPTTFVSASQLSGSVAASLVAAAGSVAISVSTNGTASNSSTFTIAPPAANPTISSLSPAAAQAGSAAFTLTVSGSGFAANSTILWNGSALSTTFGSASSLTGAVAASLIATAGTATITVSTNGTLSNSSTFTIAAPTATQTISGLSPSTAQAGSQGFNLTVSGFGFTNSSAILWNDTPLLTTFVSATQLKAPIAAILIASQATATVTVNTGGTSTSGAPFVITAPAPGPSITGLNPSTAQAGGPSFTLTVSGSGFVEGSGFLTGSSITWNGTTLPTTFVSVSQLTAIVDASLITAQSTALVSVSSASSSVPFTVLGGAGRQLTVFPAELNFSGRAGGPSPASANLSVWSQGAPIKFHVAGSTGGWLQVNVTAAQTNQDVTVTPNTTALAAGGYRGELIVQNDAKPTELQSIPVTLTLLPASDPQLEVAPLNQTIEMTKGSAPAKYQLIVTNSTGGKLQFIGQTTGGDWLDLETTFGTALASSPSSLTYVLDPTGLSAGIYNGGIIVTDINSNQRLTAQITLIVSERRKSVTVSQTALEFSVTSQQPPAKKSFGIRNEGTDPVTFSVESQTLSGGSSWLSVTPASGTLLPGATAKVDVLVSAQGFTPDRYSALIRIKTGSAGETAQTIPVVLNVQDNSALLGSRLTPAGVMISVTGGATATTKIDVSNPTGNPVTYSSVPSSEWLSVRPADGAIAPYSTVTVDVIANTTKVPLGIHSDIIRILFNDGDVSTLNVSTVISIGNTASISIGPLGAACIPSSLAVVMTSLEQGFTVTSGGVAAIKARVLDNCGNPRPTSTLIARISSDLNPVVLSHEEEGLWSGSWVTGKPQSDVRITVAAAATQGVTTLTGQASVVGTIVGALSGLAPQVDHAANAASYQAGGQISPGSWVSIFGNQLADAQVVAAGQPYPDELGGTRVTLGGIRLPLLFVDPKQLNVFIPFQVTPNSLQQMIVERGSAISIPFNIKIAQAVPGIYTMSQSGSGQGAIVLSGSGLLAAPTPLGRPARRGDALEIYATGLGLVSNLPADGQTASSTTLSPTVDPVTVTIGGVPTPAAFAGLTPGFVGLYQVNVRVPDDVQNGASIPLTISISGKESNTVTIAIE